MIDEAENENAPAGPTDAIRTLDVNGAGCQPLTPAAEPGKPEQKTADSGNSGVEPAQPDRQPLAVETPGAAVVKPRGTLGDESPCVWISEGILERIDESGLFERPLQAKAVYLALIRIANSRSSKNNIATSFECGRAFVAKKADLCLRSTASAFHDLQRAGIIGIKPHKQTPDKNGHSTYTLLTGIPTDGAGHTMHDPRARHARPLGKRMPSSFAHKEKNPQRGVKNKKETTPAGLHAEGVQPGVVQEVATLTSITNGW
jgi:hypothetical protein